VKKRVKAGISRAWLPAGCRCQSVAGFWAACLRRAIRRVVAEAFSAGGPPRLGNLTTIAAVIHTRVYYWLLQTLECSSPGRTSLAIASFTDRLHSGGWRLYTVGRQLDGRSRWAPATLDGFLWRRADSTSGGRKRFQ